MRFDNREVNVYHILEEILGLQAQWLSFDGAYTAENRVSILPADSWHVNQCEYDTGVQDYLGRIYALEIELGIFFSNMP